MQTVSLFDPAIRDDPYPTYAQLRDELPVYREPEFGSYVLSRFADVYGALRDHDTFSSARGISPGMQSGSPMAATLITIDPPRHTRMRSLVNRSFTPRGLALLEPWLRARVDEFIDEFPNLDDVDIVRSLTVPLPVSAIARVLGIPAEDRERFKRWSDAVVGATDFRAEPSPERRMQVMEMMTYFAQAIAERKAAPREDLVSTIAIAEVDGERLTDQEMLGFCLLLLVAGNETTTNLLSNALNLLASRPDLWARLRAEPALVAEAVEEALRYESPVQAFFRTTTKPVELHGTLIPENARVTVTYAAANRDGREFPNGDEFRLDRELRQHVAFGHGVHYCLGAPLARLEARVVLEQLLTRFEAIAPGPSGGRRVPSAILRGYEALHLSLTPASPRRERD